VRASSKQVCSGLIGTGASEADEEATLERLKALRRERLDPKIAEHHGRIVKTTGDGMLVEFQSRGCRSP
jgi:class 3 adenylate cyclase